MAPAPVAPAASTDPDVTPVMPEVAGGIAVRWVDPAAPWLSEVGGDAASTVHAAGLLARVALRYDDTKADLVHDQEYEAVLFPLGSHVDVTTAVAVDYDDRDLRDAAPPSCTYRLTDAPIGEASFWKQAPRDLVDHLTRSMALEIPTNPDLKLFGRAGETAEEFAARCAQVADERADAEIAKLRDKYEAKAMRLRNQIDAAADAADVAAEQQQARKRDDLLSTAGSILGGLLGGRRSRTSMIDDIGRAAGRGGKTSAAGSRVDAAQNKVDRLTADLEAVEAELAEELLEIDDRWKTVAEKVDTMSISLEKTDVKVTHLTLAWVPDCPDLGGILPGFRRRFPPRNRSRPDGGAGGGIRTHTDGDLGPAPLPIGLRRRWLDQATCNTRRPMDVHDLPTPAVVIDVARARRQPGHDGCGAPRCRAAPARQGAQVHGHRRPPARCRPHGLHVRHTA